MLYHRPVKTDHEWEYCEELKLFVMGIAQPVLSEVEGLNPSYRAGQLEVAKGKTCPPRSSEADPFDFAKTT